MKQGKKNFVRGLFLLVFIFIIILLFKNLTVDKNIQRAVMLYAMNYKDWDTNFRKKLEEGDVVYKKWFLHNAKKIELPDSVYNEVFLKNPLVKTGITNTLLEEYHHLFKNNTPSNLIYFILNPDPFLKLLNNKIYNSHNNSKIASFIKLLQDIDENKIFVIVEYDKDKGWFDFDKIYRQRQTFKEVHESELKTNGNQAGKSAN